MKSFVILLIVLQLLACEKHDKRERQHSVTCYNGKEIIIDTVSKGSVWVADASTSFVEHETGKWIKTTFPCVVSPLN